MSLTSNVCLHVAPDFEHHPLPTLVNEGLYVTLNSDDPAMFNTTLTEEYLWAAHYFGVEEAAVEQLVMNAAHVVLLPVDQKEQLIARLKMRFSELQSYF